ncbi:MAG: hypothetical protein WC137_02875 [Alphaproteobacteria bacterium]
MKDYPKEELLNYFQKNKTYFPGMFNNVLKNLSLGEFAQFVTELKTITNNDKKLWANVLTDIGYATNKDNLESISPANTERFKNASKSDRVFHQKVKIIAQLAYGIEYDLDWEKNYAADLSKNVNDKAAKYIRAKNKLDPKNHLTTEQKIMMLKKCQIENV